MTLYTKSKALQSLNQYPGIEGRNCRSLITDGNGTKIGCDNSRSCIYRKTYAVVGRVRLGKPWPLLALCPVEFSGIYYKSAQGRTMSADELCCGVYHDVCTVLDRTNQIGSCKGIVHNQGNTMLMSKICPSLNINSISVWIS